MMKTLTVTYPGGEYPIYLGKQLFTDSELLRQHIRAKQVLIVTNEVVAPLYLQTIRHCLPPIQCDELIIPDGEQYKTLTQISAILDTLANNNHHRDTTLIALGGGVVGDMTGFAAACYHRGVDFIQIPTTLLAQVDASIGGKTGVNHPKGKNLIGAFHQPKAVIIDIDTLNTLSDRHYRAGIAEIIKAALLADAKFFAYLEQHMPALLQRDAETLTTALFQACAIKRDIVAADEKEQNIRAFLNLGHTFAHAIEQNLNYEQWLHGEAVAVGIILAANLSATLEYLSLADTTRIKNLIQQAQLPDHLPSFLKTDDLIAAMWADKKILNNQLRLILLKRIGEVMITNQVTPEQIKAVIKTVGN